MRVKSQTEEPIDITWPNTPNDSQLSPYDNLDLHDAIKTKDLNAVKYVVETKNVPLDDQESFSVAVIYGGLDILKYLVEKGTPFDLGAMSWAISTKDIELMRYVSYFGLNSMTDFLSVAIQTGSLEVVKFVKGLVVSKFKHIHFRQAVEINSFEITEYVRLTLPMQFKASPMDLKTAVKNDNLELVKLVVTEGALNQAFVRGAELINLAIENRNIEMIDFIFEKGVKPNGHSINIAFESGYLRIAKHVISLGAKIDRSSALNFAIFSKNLDMVKLAVSLGATPHNNSLTHAIEKTKDIEIIKYLRSIGCQPSPTTLLSALHSNSGKEVINFIEEIIIKEIKKDPSMINRLLVHAQTRNIADALSDVQYDLSKSNSVFEAKSICEEMSSHTGKSHYDKKQFAEYFSKELALFQEDHQFNTELNSNILDRILMNQSKFMVGDGSFYTILNSFIDSSDLLNEALRTREKKEVQNWLMGMSTKGLLVNENENLFTLASFIPELIEMKKNKLEQEGVVRIDELFPKKSRSWWEEVQKLRSKINNNTRITFTKAELKEIDIERNNEEYKNMLEEIEAIPQEKKDIYKDMMTNLINHDDESFVKKDNFIKDILSNVYFGIGEIDAQKIDVEANGRKYVFEVLDKKDPLGLVVGYPAFSGCCFTIGGDSKTSLKESYINPSTGLLVVYDDKRKFLAQSWVWLTKDGESLVLDNVEFATWIKQGEETAPEDAILYKLFNADEKRESKKSIRGMIQEAYRQFAKQYKAQSGLNIFVGAGYDSLGIEEMGLEQIQDWNAYSNYPDGQLRSGTVYTDTEEEVYRLANWYNNYMTTYGLKK